MSAISHALSKSLEISTLLRSIKYLSSFTGDNPYSASFFLPHRFIAELDNCSVPSSFKKLHGCMIVRGFGKNILGVPKLPYLFVKFNLFTEQQWFKQSLKGHLPLRHSKVVDCFRYGEYGDVLRLYVVLRQKNITINGTVITFGLKSCIYLSTLEFGRSIHTDALKFGLCSNQYVGSSLIRFYCGWGYATEAAKAFDEIIERDVVVYSSLIAGYAQQGCHYASKAFKVARDMQRDGFEPNRVTLVSLLRCSSRIGAIIVGEMIHGYAIRRQIGRSNEIFETSLMSMYLKCGNPERAALVFNWMNKRSVGSWNALVAGHLQFGQPLEALNLLLLMGFEKCELDLFALANGLLICAELRYYLLGKTIHGYIIRQGVNLDLVGTTTLINMYSNCNDLTGAMNTFYRTKDKDCILFNVMISGFLHNGCAFQAMETFSEMVSEGIRPNASTIITVLSVFSDREDEKTFKCIHGYVFRQGLHENTEVGNQLVYMFGRWGFIESAKDVFDLIKFKDRVSWTTIMSGHVNQGLSNEALAFFRLMQKEKLSLDSVTFSSLLQALNQLGAVSSTREVHGHLYRTFLEIDVLLMNSMITTYSKWGKLKMASNLFENMVDQDLSTWNTIIAAHGMHGEGRQAIKLFHRMKEMEVFPDDITFKSVLSACSHSGLIYEGLDIFNSMAEEYGIVPSKDHYGCLIDLLGRSGRLEEAYNLLARVPVAQKISSLGALLGACRIHEDLEMGERVGKWILSVDHQSTSAYCSVSNIYAEGRKWDVVAQLGDIANRRGLKRTPGYSSLVNFE